MNYLMLAVALYVTFITFHYAKKVWTIETKTAAIIIGLFGVCIPVMGIYLFMK